VTYTINRWEARGGKRWLELYFDDRRRNYSYRTDNGGGSLGTVSMVEALERLDDGPLQALRADFPSTRMVFNNA